MPTNLNPIDLVIYVEGGLVQAVFSNSSTPIRVAIQDFDVEGADVDKIAILANGQEFIGHVENTYRNDVRVAEVFNAFELDVRTTDEQQENYVAHKGMICPSCGANDVEAGSHLETDGPNACVSVECCQCAATWTDNYRLVGFSDLLEPLPTN